MKDRKGNPRPRQSTPPPPGQMLPKVGGERHGKQNPCSAACPPVSQSGPGPKSVAGGVENKLPVPTPYAFRRASWPCVSCTGGAPTAAAYRHLFWAYIRLVLYLYTFGLRMCADSTTPSYLAVSGGLAGGVREVGPALLFLSSPLVAARVEAWLEGLLLRLALAGPAGYLKNALLRRRLVCYVAH